MDTANNFLNIIVDCSGSMIESSKLLIVRNIVRQVEQYIRLGYAAAQIRLFAANKNIRKVDWTPDQEYPQELWECDGSFEPEQWTKDFFESSGKFLLLSDCSLDVKSKSFLSDWANKTSPDSIRIVKIGNESMPKISSIQIFDTEDILAALDHWLGEK